VDSWSTAAETPESTDLACHLASPRLNTQEARKQAVDELWMWITSRRPRLASGPSYPHLSPGGL